MWAYHHNVEAQPAIPNVVQIDVGDLNGRLDIAPQRGDVLTYNRYITVIVLQQQLHIGVQLLGQGRLRPAPMPLRKQHLASEVWEREGGGEGGVG